MKYKLIKSSKKRYRGADIYRIVALRDINTQYGLVLKGDTGGWVEKYHNLSQEGNCWVADEAIVYENAEIQDNAEVADEAEVFDAAIVRGEARIYGQAAIYGDAEVQEYVWVAGKGRVPGGVILTGREFIIGNLPYRPEEK